MSEELNYDGALHIHQSKKISSEIKDGKLIITRTPSMLDAQREPEFTIQIDKIFKIMHHAKFKLSFIAPIQNSQEINELVFVDKNYKVLVAFEMIGRFKADQIIKILEDLKSYKTDIEVDEITKLALQKKTLTPFRNNYLREFWRGFKWLGIPAIGFVLFIFGMAILQAISKSI